MKRLALLAAATTAFLAFADPLPYPPAKKCTAALRATEGRKCLECDAGTCETNADAGYSFSCAAPCRKGPCAEVWCTAPAAKPRRAD